MSNTVWGLALGNSTWRLARLERDASGAIACTEHITDFCLEEALVADATSVLEEIDGLIPKNEPVVLSLPGSAFLTREVQLPDLAEKPDAMIEYELSCHVPFPLEQTVWRVEQGKRDARSAHFQIHLIKKSELDEIAACARKRTFRVVGIVPEFHSIRAFARYELKAKPPYALVYGDQDGAELCVLADLEETVRRVSVDLKAARQETFAKLIGHRLLQLCGPVKLATPETLYLFGSEIQAAARTTASRLKGVTVSAVTQLNRIKFAGDVKPEKMSEDVPEFAAALGAGLMGLHGVPQSLNFQPPKLRDWSKAAMLAGGVVAGLVCMLAIIGVIADEPQRPTMPPAEITRKPPVSRAQPKPRAPAAVPPSQFNTAQGESYGRALQEFLNTAECRGVMVARNDGALLAKRGYSFSFNSDSKASEWIVTELAKSRQPKALGHVIPLSNTGESAMLHHLRDGQVLVAIFDNSRNDSALLESVMMLKQKLQALSAGDAKK